MKKRVAVLPFPNIKNAYVLISAQWNQDLEEDPKRIVPIMSFLYDNGKYATEWEPQYGPIVRWTKADTNTENKQEHYFYDYVIPNNINWSQLAVDREGLKDMFVEGNYEAIFIVLKRWANRDDD